MYNSFGTLGFILFATRKLFAAEDTWVRKEFRLASMSKKKKYVVWLDDLNPYENPNDVHSKLKAWYVDVDDLQGIRMAGKTVEHIAWTIVTEFHLIQEKKPQPTTPAFNTPLEHTSLFKERKIGAMANSISEIGNDFQIKSVNKTVDVYIDCFFY